MLTVDAVDGVATSSVERLFLKFDSTDEADSRVPLRRVEIDVALSSGMLISAENADAELATL